jgi:N-acyl homoserine lactone hydrolase
MYTVLPVHVGTLRVDKSSLTYLRNFGQSVEVPCIIWVIRGAGRTVIVDSGPPDPLFTTRYHAPMTREPGQEPAIALRAAGVDASAVETVIISHLHYDHAYNNHLFPRARFLVQKAELAYAQSPLPIHAPGYEASSAGFDQAFVRNTKWTVVDGDVDMCPGVRLLLTPGHTPGLQSVAVETSVGKVIITSDTVPLAENWCGEPPVIPHLPSGVHYALPDYFATFDKLEREGGRILPGHDFSILTEGLIG